MMSEEIDKQKLAVDFHKAVGRNCRAGSVDYGYLTSWGGMPSYIDDVLACLDGAGKFAEDNDLPWSFGKEGELFFYRLEGSVFESKDATDAIMTATLKYRDTEIPEFTGTREALDNLGVKK